ncbi:MAG TPA: hypothetical protein VE860_22405, partial [Chthoniobacterales bacterium]|nr:hypothetical protein [Chthoniobacterales bacterium]
TAGPRGRGDLSAIVRRLPDYGGSSCYQSSNISSGEFLAAPGPPYRSFPKSYSSSYSSSNRVPGLLAFLALPGSNSLSAASFVCQDAQNEHEDEHEHEHEQEQE